MIFFTKSKFGAQNLVKHGVNRFLSKRVFLGEHFDRKSSSVIQLSNDFEDKTNIQKVPFERVSRMSKNWGLGR